ncbi:MAG: VCBS repeat-containing protein [Nitrospinae bacterium]|nr:VCBS repeat-containing protein [Nitrospinota bacterium]
MPPAHAQRVRRWRIRICAQAVVPALLLLLACTEAAWAQSFAMYDLRVDGRVLTLIPADLNRDRRPDLLVISKKGTFPQEARWASVFWQQEGGGFNVHPDLVWEVDPEATVIDVGPLGPDPDEQAIVYLAGSEVRFYQLEDGTRPAPRTLLKSPTFTVFPEPGDLPPWTLIHDWKGLGHPWLGVPEFGKLMLYPLGVDGQLTVGEPVHVYQPTRVSTGDDSHRLLRDYSLQLVYRFPQLFVQDFNGDGRADLIVAWQEDVAVHLQDASGHFPPHPSQTFHFDLRTEREKSLRTVLVTPLVEDLNQDGYADLILTKMTGRATERRIVTAVYRNQGGSLPSKPDAQIEHEGFGTTLLVKDINGDGKRDLIFPLVKIGVANLVRNLLTSRVDVSLFAHLYQGQPAYLPAADWTRTFGYQVDMSDGVRLEGAWPNIEGDFDGDGRADLLVSGNHELSVYLAIAGASFAPDPAIRLKVKTSPYLLVRDLNNDGLADILMWYDREPEWRGVMKVLMNTGRGWANKADPRGAEAVAPLPTCSSQEQRDCER